MFRLRWAEVAGSCVVAQPAVAGSEPTTLVRDVEVGSSNLFTPTIFSPAESDT